MVWQNCYYKKISEQDLVEEHLYGINLFEKFEQTQETNLDNNNYLVSSHITTSSKLSHSVPQQNVNQKTDDLIEKTETEITNDSDLVTVETKSDEDVTNALSEIQSKQYINFYSVQDLQDKIQNQQNEYQDINQNQDQQKDQNQDQQEGNRLLQNENGDVQSISETQFESQLGVCLSGKFNQKRTLKEVTVLKQRIGLSAEFQGTLKEQKFQDIQNLAFHSMEIVERIYQRDIFHIKGNHQKL
ncbi:unnamed protein product [Paramecium pentaurelia]|uniref:Uncharacterized protein n=1 Tax=Paramecium pentaurelia TaxID=43138 RepID=A0A8S1RYP2_9CILI|nr:unnamed protein product [Paramecium pentaurelia]